MVEWSQSLLIHKIEIIPSNPDPAKSSPKATNMHANLDSTRKSAPVLLKQITLSFYFAKKRLRLLKPVLWLKRVELVIFATTPCWLELRRNRMSEGESILGEKMETNSTLGSTSSLWGIFFKSSHVIFPIFTIFFPLIWNWTKIF